MLLWTNGNEESKIAQFWWEPVEVQLHWGGAATTPREGISGSWSEWQPTWAVVTGCWCSGLTSGLVPQGPGWIGLARGLVEALQICCFHE